jgi:hypothetical protein
VALFLGAALVAWAQGHVNRGYALADQVCGAGGMLCSNPRLLLFAAIGVGLIALFRVSVKQ